MTKTEDELILELIVAEERSRNRSSSIDVSNQQTESTKTQPDKTESDSPERQNTIAFPQETVEEEERITFIEERDVMLQQGVWNTPQSKDEVDDLHHLPITGSGKLENFLVVADKPDFNVKVGIDDNDVVDDSFEFVESISNELTKVSAYSTLDNVYVVSVTGYEFRNRFNASIRPTAENVTFSIIRVELELE